MSSTTGIRARDDALDNKNGDGNDAYYFAHMRSDWPKVPGISINGNNESDGGSAPPLNSATPELGALMAQHDKPHRHSAIEWWYINGHVDVVASASANGGAQVRPMSFFAAFFRLHVADAKKLKPEAEVQDIDRERTLNEERLYSLNWAVTDHADNTYRPFAFVDQRTPAALLEMMGNGAWQGNPHLLTALKEVFRHDSVPAPDMLFTKESKCDEDKLNVSLQGCTFKAVRNPGANKVCPHKYELHLEGEDDKGKIMIDVVFDPTKQPVLHGRNGVVSVSNGGTAAGPEDMFYYFFPRCNFGGTVHRESASGDSIKTERIAGTGWYDHEFGGCIPHSREELQRAVVEPAKARNGAEYTWEWAALQLSNDVEVSAVRLKCGGGDAERLIDTFIVAREGSNPSYRIDGNNNSAAMVFEKLQGGKFQSTRTSQEFSTRWRLAFTSPLTGAKVDLTLDTATIDQEFITLAAKPSFWEGHVACSGTWGDSNNNSNRVSGHGYLECRGSVTGSIENFFDIMHTLLCFPLKTVAPSLSGSSPRDFHDFIAREMDASLQGSPLAGLLDSDSKEFLAAIGCAYVYTIKAGRNVRGRMLDWLEDKFVEHPHHRAPPFHLVLLRAFSLREMDVASGLVPEPAICADPVASSSTSSTTAASNNSANDGATSNEGDPSLRIPGTNEAAVLDRVSAKLGFRVAPFHVPASDSALTATPTAAEMRLVEQLYTGKWEMQRDRSEATSTLLSAQGVNIFIRALTDRLTPTLETTVQVSPLPTVTTRVTTALSEDISKTEIGREAKWFSKGRGELTSRACLQDGGRTLYARTYVPPHQTTSVEHKWTRVEETKEGGADGQQQRRCVEFYRFDPTGQLSDQSLYAGRLFLSKE